MTEPTPSQACEPRLTLIEIVGLGVGPRGFRCIRLDGEERANAVLHFDLHSAMRVTVDGEVYDASNAEIRAVSE